jgi:uncharacterized protein (DUF2252 family)
MAAEDKALHAWHATAGPSPAPTKAPHLTPEERAVLGKAARDRVPRESHADWKPRADRPDPVVLLGVQAATRIPELVSIRYGRMVASPFAFYRGAAAIMASDLAATPQSGIQVQLCGDAHLANFGGFASPERDLVLDINDFDETLPGPWEWDVKRLVASIEVAARTHSFDADVRRSLTIATVAEYRQAMQEFAAMGNLEVWYLHLDMAGVRRRWGRELPPAELRLLDRDFSKGRARDNVRAAEKLTRRKDGALRIASSPPLVVPVEELLPEADRCTVEAAMRQYIDRYCKSLQDSHRHLLEGYEYTDMARKVVGVGSVGMHAWIVLLIGRDVEDPLLLQFKEAQASVLEPYLGRSRFADHGQRVVEGQRWMQATSDIFLGWMQVSGILDSTSRAYYVRQLWDWKTSADVETMSPRELMVYAQMCGWTLARAHARSGDPIAIASYLGKGPAFEQAIADFAAAYAEQNERDYRALRQAVENGRVSAETGP